MNRDCVVIDTNVFISALLNPNGTPRKVINLVSHQSHKTTVCSDLDDNKFLEYS